jgi:hypothetical protein
MKTLSTAIVLAALLALPAAAAAAKPDPSDKRAAIAQCKSERGKTKATRKAFKAKYHSFSRCVRENAAEEAGERKAAHRSAAKECKAQGLKGRELGKCVSELAKRHKQAEDEEDANEVAAFKNAAKQCQAESTDADFAAEHGGKTFAEFYGTNKNRRNAFGKCVSSKTSGYTDPFS